MRNLYCVFAFVSLIEQCDCINPCIKCNCESTESPNNVSIYVVSDSIENAKEIIFSKYVGTKMNNFVVTNVLGISNIQLVATEDINIGFGDRLLIE